MEFTINQIAQLIEGKVEGEGNDKVSRLDKIQEGRPGGISFLANEKYEPYIYKTEATAVIVSADFKATKKINTTLIRVGDAYLGFTKLLEAYAALTKTQLKGTEEPNFFHKSSQMGAGGFRGSFSYVHKNCIIGNEVILYPTAYIGANVKIGDHTIIHPGARICDNTLIGKHCEIHPNAVIGSDGFGFAPQKDGTYRAIPQLGNVIIEDYVSIGAGTTIDRATFGSTHIKSGVKIDNLVQIAHNVIVGENTVIASQTGISGSTEIGKNCVIAGQAGIVGHIKIADNTTIGANTGISKSIQEPGKTLFGYISMDLKDFLKSYSIFRKLPSLQNRINELEKKL